MYFCLEIHQVSTKYHPKYDIFPILFIVHSTTIVTLSFTVTLQSWI